MEYLKVTFPVNSRDVSDILTALLADAGFDGFEEAGNELLAYIERAKLDKELLDEIAGVTGLVYTTELIAPQNWNEVWESNFPPVIVEDFCTIRAHFHDIRVTTPYEILITPKMSFGTGHHATTQLMMLLMRDTAFTGRTVVDFGCGTGVLAILAEKLGASRVLAIDNDEWCVENTLENIARNNCDKIKVKQGSLEDAVGEAEVILANINRHILLHYMEMLFNKLKSGGVLLMSGLLADDETIIVEAARKQGFIHEGTRSKANWISLVFNKL
jgi:ribosomal protein L11 methyltransferase